MLPGAGGELDASWSASQDAGFDKPWVFNAEGRGKGMTSGPSEIDRLMGAEPRLNLSAQFFGSIRAEIADQVGEAQLAQLEATLTRIVRDRTPKLGDLPGWLR